LFVIYYKQSHQLTTQLYYPTYYPTNYPTTNQQPTTTITSTRYVNTTWKVLVLKEDVSDVQKKRGEYDDGAIRA